MNKHRKYFLSISTLILLIWGCTEKIDLQLDSSYTRLVVEGAITTDTTAQIVKLTTTSSYFYNQPAPAVSGAILTISDGFNTWPMSETQPGIYRTSDDVYGVPNHTYTLKITLKETVNGHSDYEASSLLRPIVPMDSVRLKYHPDWGKQGVYEVQCYVLDPPTTDFYMFDVYRNNILVTDTINERQVVDDELYNGNYTNGIGVGYFNQSRADEKLVPGDEVKLEVSSLTSEYAKFIWAVQSEVNGQTPLFSGPPANVQGNLNNGAVGFFAAYSITRGKTVVK
jgi:hypothetical protein